MKSLINILLIKHWNDLFRLYPFESFLDKQSPRIKLEENIKRDNTITYNDSYRIEVEEDETLK